MTLSLGHIFVYETLGTALLLLLGCGVVATAILRNSKGDGGGWLLINFGWGIGVFVGVYAAFPTGAHLNPAVTVSQWMMGNIDAGQAFTYFAGEFVGAFLGAVLRWLAFREHFDAEEDPGKKLAVFSTGPAIRSPIWNIVTEVIATFVLIFWILISVAHRALSDRWPSPSSWLASARPSEAPPATPSTRPVTSAHASPTRFSRSKAKARPTGPTVGSPSSPPSSARSWPPSYSKPPTRPT